MRRSTCLALLCTVALACGSDKKQPPVATHSPLADSADQVMYGAQFNLTDQGLSRARMNADTAYFFDDNTRMEFENVTTTFFTATGAKDAVLTSRNGSYNSRTNNMIARHNVVVVSEDGRRLTTEELKYNQQTNQISSDTSFVMTEPNRRLTGIGFRSDPNMRNIQILKGASGFARGVSTESTVLPAPGNPPTVLPAPAKTPTVLPAPSSTPPRR
jgi:LPS export ABC transporter protein LptC